MPRLCDHAPPHLGCRVDRLQEDIQRRTTGRTEQSHNRSWILHINLAGDEDYYRSAMQRQSEMPRNNSYRADLELCAEGIRYLAFFLNGILVLALRKPERNECRHVGVHVGDLRCERRAASEARGGWENHDPVHEIRANAKQIPNKRSTMFGSLASSAPRSHMRIWGSDAGMCGQRRRSCRKQSGAVLADGRER